jgi:riboflavin synthase
MFTGLIQALGTIQPLGNDRFRVSVTHHASAIMSDLAEGDSVATDGVCLTVEDILPNGFVATASPETLKRTNLQQHTEAATYVNLETSLRAGGKLGGHFVTGHIDGVGQLLDVIATQTAWEITFSAILARAQQWQQIARYLIPKGSVAVNGISLTIAECDPEGNWFKAAVIPHTYQATNLQYLEKGNWVNIESDILGKYVDKLLGHRPSQSEEVSLQFLAEHGYL